MKQAQAIGRRQAHCAIIAAAFGAALGVSSHASAATYYWDTNNETAGGGTAGAANGTWATGVATWSNNIPDGTGTPVNWATGNDAVFSAGTDVTSATATLTGNLTVISMTVEEGNVTINPTATQNITLSGGGITVAGGSTLTTNTILASGGGAINKQGTGVWQIGNSVNPVQTHVINAGTIRLTQGSANATTAAIANGGSLQINANGTFDVNSRREVVNTYKLYGGTILSSTNSDNNANLDDDPQIGIQAVTGGTYDLQKGTISVGLYGLMPANKTTNDTVTLSGRSMSMTGPTNVDGGRLIVTGQNSIAFTDTALTTTPITTVNNGGTLAVSGTAVDNNSYQDTGKIGRLVVNSGGTVDPGTEAGTLGAMLVRGGASDGFTLNSGGTLQIDIAGATAGSGYDQVRVTTPGTAAPGSTTAVSLAGNLNVSVLGGYQPADGQLFFILTQDLSTIATVPATSDPQVGNVSGTFAGLADGSLFTSGGVDFRISYFGDSANNLFTGGNDVVLQAVVVPEPSSIAIIGAAALLLARRQRRSSN